MAAAALLMVGSLDEDTVDFVPNYDDTQWQPSVMPAAYPNLLVNGAAGIAVGMATNMAPHNLVEVIGAARHLIAHPTCSLEDLMKFVPGPDLPCGGKIVGLEGIRDAYLTGRGSFRTRATTRIEALTPRRKGIVVTELPYLVGPEKVIDKVKDLVQSKRLQGIADLKDLSDRQNGLRLVIEIKNGFHPEAVLEQLFRLTPMEENFGINNVALVEGQPRTMGLKELLKVYVDFRTDVVRRRSRAPAAQARGAPAPRRGPARRHRRHRRGHPGHPHLRRRRDRPHPAHGRLRPRRGAGHLHPRAAAAAPHEVLASSSSRPRRPSWSVPSRSCARCSPTRSCSCGSSPTSSPPSPRHTAPRGAPCCSRARDRARPPPPPAPLEVSDDPCWVLLSSTGLLARTGSAEPIPTEGSRSKHDVIIGAVRTTARGEFGLATTAGRMIRLSALDLPTLPPTNGAPSLSGGAPLAAYVDLPKGEEPVTILPIGADAPVLALGTASGVVKRVVSRGAPERRVERHQPQGRRPRRRRGRGRP